MIFNIFQAFEAIYKQFIAAKTSNKKHHADISEILTDINKTQDNVLDDVTEFYNKNTTAQLSHGEEMKEKITTVKNDVEKNIDEVNIRSLHISAFVYIFVTFNECFDSRLQNISILNTVALRGRDLIKQLESQIQERNKTWIKYRNMVEQNVDKLRNAAEDDKGHIASSAQVFICKKSGQFDSN